MIQSQSYDYPNASEIALNDTGKLGEWLTPKIQQNTLMGLSMAISFKVTRQSKLRK